MEKLIITPKVKVAALLDAYPQLEETLVAMSPAFGKLRNPMLRKTIARATSLNHAAQIAGISVNDMVTKLRAEVGQGEEFFAETGALVTEEPPEWFAEERIVDRLDARVMLESGEHPIHLVFESIKKLQDEEIFELLTPFLPAPLIDKAKALGYKVWTKQKAEQEFFTYFKN